jgi:uncharacterized protein
MLSAQITVPQYPNKEKTGSIQTNKQTFDILDQTSVQNLTELTERIEKIANRLHLQRVFAFGSFARGQIKDTSDVDLFVSGPNFSSYSAIWEVQDELEKVLGRKVDLFPIEDLPCFPTEGQKLVRKDLKLIYSSTI